MMPTIEQLRVQANRTVPGKIAFQLSMWDFNKPTYEQWVTLVEEAVYYQLTGMSQRRSDFHDLDEDALSSFVTHGLNCLRLTAKGEKINGNTDITVSYDDFIWLAEAKLGDDVNKIYGGYLQLTKRYATGIPNQSSGGMLLYCTNQSSKAVLAGWRAALDAQVPHSNSRLFNNITFRSSDRSEATELDLEIMHYAFPLWHNPQEEKLKLSAAARKNARKAKRGVKKRELSEDE
jgi:hypothetical protein